MGMGEIEPGPVPGPPARTASADGDGAMGEALYGLCAACAGCRADADGGAGYDGESDPGPPCAWYVDLG